MEEREEEKIMKGGGGWRRDSGGEGREYPRTHFCHEGAEASGQVQPLEESSQQDLFAVTETTGLFGSEEALLVRVVPRQPYQTVKDVLVYYKICMQIKCLELSSKQQFLSMTWTH